MSASYPSFRVPPLEMSGSARTQVPMNVQARFEFQALARPPLLSMLLHLSLNVLGPASAFQIL